MYTPQGIALLGGSFNPPHIGHIRLALEVAQNLPQVVGQVHMIPCATPPHKEGKGLLPFALRAAMLEATLRPFPTIQVNRIEASREGLSYTWDTLLAYHAQQPQVPLYFVLGAGDFAQLDTWHKGLRLPELTNFIVVPRADNAREVFLQTVQRFWQQAYSVPPLLPQGISAALPQGGAFHFVPLPRLDISASLIRQHWLAGKNIDFLVPDVVVPLLRQHKHSVMQHWATHKNTAHENCAPSPRQESNTPPQCLNKS